MTTSRSDVVPESDAQAIEALNRARPHDLGSSGLKWDVATPDPLPCGTAESYLWGSVTEHDPYSFGPKPLDVIKDVAKGAAICFGAVAVCMGLGYLAGMGLEAAQPWIEAGKSAVLAWWLR